MAIAISGCGAGFGAGEGEGSAELRISRDYGAQVLFSDDVGPLRESSTAMRLLDGAAEIETRYGGGFVDSINGVASSAGSRSCDWFYFVNGIAAERGAAEFVPGPGDRIWWDYRDWTDARDVNAVVGSFPAPLSGGHDGRVWPVTVVCLDAAEACRVANRGLSDAGIDAEPAGPGEAADDTIRVLVGTWPAVSRDRDAARLASNPGASGVFAGFRGIGRSARLLGFDQSGRPAADFGRGTGLVAAMRSGEDPPLWLVTAFDEAGVEAAAAALNATDLEGRYAAAVTPASVVSLPVESEAGSDPAGGPQ